MAWVYEMAFVYQRNSTFNVSFAEVTTHLLIGFIKADTVDCMCNTSV